MSAKYEDGLFANIREKDDLIVVLKRALAEKTKRQDELEFVLTLLDDGHIFSSEDGLSSRQQSPPSSESRQKIELPKQMSAREALSDILNFEDTLGLYSDNWLAAKSSLAISDMHLGATLSVTFFLPALPGLPTKPLKLSSNFFDPYEISIVRGHPTLQTCVIPQELAVTPRINLNTIEEPRNEHDLRDLGVLLVSIETNNSAIV